MALSHDVAALLERSSGGVGMSDLELHPPLWAGAEPVFCGLRNCVVVVGGASRGIGYAMALRFARGRAVVCVLSRSSGGISFGPGSIEQAVADINAAGGEGFGVACDLSSEESIEAAIGSVVTKYGKIDVLVNSASSHFEQSTAELDVKRYDSMNSVGPRGTYLLTMLALPHMRTSFNPQVLTIAPAAQLHPSYFVTPAVAYTAAKMTMTLISIGLAAAQPSVSFNTLWPAYGVLSHATDAISRKISPEMADEYLMGCVHPTMMADAAYRLVTSTHSSGAFLDEAVLRSMGLQDFSAYMVVPERQTLAELNKDYFVGAPLFAPPQSSHPPPSAREALRGACVVVVGTDELACEVAALAEAEGAAVECVDYSSSVVALQAFARRVEDQHSKVDALFFSDWLDAPPRLTRAQARRRQLRQTTTAFGIAAHWDRVFNRHCKATYFTTQALLPLLRASPHACVLHVTPPPVCDPLDFEADRVVETICKHVQALHVIGHAREFSGSIRVNAIWSARGAAPLSASACVDLLTAVDGTATGTFYAAPEGAVAPPPVPAGAPCKRYPFTQYAGEGTELEDASAIHLRDLA